MEVEIITTEHIKPSSPTPQHLKIFKLSLLDQLVPSPYAPINLFYRTEDLEINPSRLELLKKSLSNTLTRFYPLAGRIKDDLSIDCNDKGAYFVGARVNCSLDEFLDRPDLLLLPRFFPCETILKGPIEGSCVTNIQVNVFECGGIAIGICISHKILDGVALSTFLKAWTSTARGCINEDICPNFIATSLFPADDLWLRDSSLVMWGSLLKKGKSITKRIVFSASSIAALRAQATISGLCPTRVEAVSALLWKSTIAACRAKTGFCRPSVLTHLVNLRRRIMAQAQPLENSTGNLLWIAYARSKAESELDLTELVGHVREAISRVDGDFMKDIRDEERKSLIFETFREISNLVSEDGLDHHHVGFSSWCKLGFYEADFGWGKPVWISSYGIEDSVHMNLIILVDTRSGDGMEAWVTLDEQDMAILERDEQLFKLAIFDPSPLMME